MIKITAIFRPDVSAETGLAGRHNHIAIASPRHQAVLHLARGGEVTGEPQPDTKDDRSDDQTRDRAAAAVAGLGFGRRAGLVGRIRLGHGYLGSGTLSLGEALYHLCDVASHLAQRHAAQPLVGLIASLRQVSTAGTACCVRGAQLVRMNAVWVHSHAAPKTVLSMGCGRAANRTAPATAAAATVIATAFRLSRKKIMPVLRRIEADARRRRWVPL